MNKHELVKSKPNLTPASSLLAAFLLVCGVCISVSEGSADIDPATHNWSVDYDGYISFYAANSSGNGYHIVMKRKDSTSSLNAGHCETGAGTKLKHRHWEREFTGTEEGHVNNFYDWMYSSEPGIIRIGSPWNAQNCLSWAMDGYAAGANYNYWVDPGTGAQEGNKIFTDDCLARWPNDAQACDRLAYNELGSSEICHATIVCDVSGVQPTELEWKQGYSARYNYDTTGASNKYSTPGCDVNYNLGSAPTGDWWADYYWGIFATCTVYYDP